MSSATARSTYVPGSEKAGRGDRAAFVADRLHPRLERHRARTPPVHPGDGEAGDCRAPRIDDGLRLRSGAHGALGEGGTGRRNAVITHQHGQLQRVRQRHGARLGTVDADERLLIVHVSLGRAAAPVQAHDVPVDLPHRPERPVGLVGAAVVRKGPDEVLVAPVGRHAHLEDELLPARVEVCGLPPVGFTRFQVVVRADRNYRLFLVVPVQIAEHHVERAVGVALPALEDRLDVLAPQPGGLAVERAPGGEREGSRDQAGDCACRHWHTLDGPRCARPDAS